MVVIARGKLRAEIFKTDFYNIKELYP